MRRFDEIFICGIDIACLGNLQLDELVSREFSLSDMPLGYDHVVRFGNLVVREAIPDYFPVLEILNSYFFANTATTLKATFLYVCFIAFAAFGGAQRAHIIPG